MICPVGSVFNAFPSTRTIPATGAMVNVTRRTSGLSVTKR